MKQKIYLDYNASTPVHPEVADAITQHFKEITGNPSSIHSYGKEARNQLTKARDNISSFLGVDRKEIIFTSGGTEALNMVIRGVIERHPGCHVITSDVEHVSVYMTIKKYEAEGRCQATFLSAGLWGAVEPEAVKAALQPDTGLIALLAANNETGVKTDIDGIAKIAQDAGVHFLVDAIALLGKEPFTIPSGATAMCFSGGKCYAPKGIGCAFIRSHLKLEPLIIGGEHEFKRRAGTENLHGIIALSKTIDIIKREMPSANKHMKQLRDKFEMELIKRIPGVEVNGQGPRVVNTSNISFPGVDGETLLTLLDMEGIAVSHGSACASGALEPSRVLLNMGIPRDVVQSSVRFSLGYFTTEEEIKSALDSITEIIFRLRGKY